MTRKPLRKITSRDPEEEYVNFGDCVTADHIIAQDLPDQGLGREKGAIVILDRATGWIDAEAARGLNRSAGPRSHIARFHSDPPPAAEPASAAKDLSPIQICSCPRITR